MLIYKMIVMIDQIIIPRKEVIKLRIPKEMIGKTMKLIAFEISELDNTEQRQREIEELTQNSLIDLSNFVFDRIEANNYDE